MTSEQEERSAPHKDHFVIEGDGDIVDVTAYCVGCGEVCFEEKMLRNTVEDLEIEHPVHDRHECREKAKDVVA